MLAKISSKHQITIPKIIANAFDLRKGDVLEIEKRGHKIVMAPKEVILEDKYPKEDLEIAEKVLSKGLKGEEISFDSGDDMITDFRRRIKRQ